MEGVVCVGVWPRLLSSDSGDSTEADKGKRADEMEGGDRERTRMCRPDDSYIIIMMTRVTMITMLIIILLMIMMLITIIMIIMKVMIRRKKESENGRSALTRKKSP